MNAITYSVLDLATVVQHHTIADTFRNSVENAQQAEQLGYKRYWFAEHHNMINVASSATVLLIGQIAGQTKTIRVGSGGIMLPNHSPLVVAEQFGTLETLYPGRIDLGLGRAPGTDQTTAYAIRGENMNAAFHFPQDVAALEHYFKGDHPNGVSAIPGEGLDIPIWILGSSPDSAVLASAKGLPYAFASHFAPTHFLQAITLYRENFKPSAYLDKPYVLSCVNVVAADTDEEARRLYTSLQQMFRGIVTGQRQLLPPPVDSMESVWSYQESAAAMQMLKYSFVGSQQTVKKQLHEFIDKTGVDEIMITSHIYDHQARLKSYRLVAEALNG
ncbi:LLM class flavin-dependent oxidoreductase [Mucilaginibacter sp. RS28]|uniref:Luciferase-like monooxygenase n=1 Tax=Mucilaginibacter straminoryzae TaxID=2932774 RepID=A0A9X2BDN3_9SPHI|nr:LLM class flavin-dependent oxidoreductase [Mucilaginibacter straminoryzae]MCJ8210513.1 LLM class flavin-dependent oxidoreductase [Mucilaginibacter straminoryzae]